MEEDGPVPMLLSMVEVMHLGQWVLAPTLHVTFTNNAVLYYILEIIARV